MTKDEYGLATRIIERIGYFNEVLDFLKGVDLKEEATKDELREFMVKIVNAGLEDSLRLCLWNLRDEVGKAIEQLESELKEL